MIIFKFTIMLTANCHEYRRSRTYVPWTWGLQVPSKRRASVSPLLSVTTQKTWILNINALKTSSLTHSKTLINHTCKVIHCHKSFIVVYDTFYYQVPLDIWRIFTKRKNIFRLILYISVYLQPIIGFQTSRKFRWWRRDKGVSCEIMIDLNLTVKHICHFVWHLEERYITKLDTFE
jgi:hypothetical protein